jgi:hypothetical protein
LIKIATYFQASSVFPWSLQRERKLIEKRSDGDTAIDALDLLLQSSELQFAEGTAFRCSMSRFTFKSANVFLARGLGE